MAPALQSDGATADNDNRTGSSMQSRMNIISQVSIFGLAGVGLHTAHAICLPDDTECPPSRNPPPRSCSDPAPYPADTFTVQCMAADGSRCANTITLAQ